MSCISGHHCICFLCLSHARLFSRMDDRCYHHQHRCCFRDREFECTTAVAAYGSASAARVWKMRPHFLSGNAASFVKDSHFSQNLRRVSFAGDARDRNEKDPRDESRNSEIATRDERREEGIIGKRIWKMKVAAERSFAVFCCCFVLLF